MPSQLRIVRKVLPALDPIGALVRIPAGELVSVIGNRDEIGFIEVRWAARTVRIHADDLNESTVPTGIGA